MITYSKPTKRTIKGEPSRYYYTRERDTITGARRWVNLGKASFEAAREHVRSLELQDAKGEAPREDARFSAAVDRWLELKKRHMTPAGHSTYSIYAGHWTAHFSESATVRGITPRHLEDYFLHRAKDVSNATLNKERAMLKQFFRWAHEHSLTEDLNPVRTTGRLKEDGREIRALSPEEQARLLEACVKAPATEHKGKRNAGGRAGGKKTKGPRTWKQKMPPPPSYLAPLVKVALATGLRLGNLEALAWGDIGDGQIRIGAKKMKGRKEHVLPLDKDTLILLDGLRRGATSMKVFDLPDRRSVVRAFEAAVRRAGVGPCRFHDLRATFISSCCRAGIGLEVVARLAAHASVTTTAKFYRQIQDSELRAAMERRAESTTPGGAASMLEAAK